MIEGHGDDAYRYPGITSDFSSNICLPPHRHEALMAHLAARPEILLHYPEPEAWSLETMLAESLGIDPACVIVTSGATEAIYLIAQTFPYRPVIPAPTFREYEDAYSIVGNASERCDTPQSVTLGGVTHYATLGGVTHYATLGGVTHYGDTILWLCNPNNPTGEAHTPDSIDGMAAGHTLTVIDQSYEHYTAIPTMSAKNTVLRKDIILIHSMTKTYAVPGLRLGYIVAHRCLTEQLRRHLRPWSVSALAVEAGKFLLQHDELICRPDLAEARRLHDLLSAIPGITVSPSDTNFMLCRLPVVGRSALPLGSPKNASVRCSVVGRSAPPLGSSKNASERCDTPQPVTLGGVTHYVTLGGVTHYVTLGDVTHYVTLGGVTHYVTLGGVTHYTAAELKEYLAREHRMLIRDASNFRGLTPQHFRVAAQSPEENDALVAAIKEYMNQSCSISGNSC